MKNLLLIFWSLCSLMGAAFAESSQEGEHAETVTKSLKVSEFNANIFSAIYDFFQRIKTTFFEGFISLKDFIETEEWLIAELGTSEKRNAIEAFGIHLSIALAAAFILAQLVAWWIRPKIHNLLLNQDQLILHKYTQFMNAASFSTTTSHLSDYLISQNQKRLIKATLLSTVAPFTFGFLFYTIFRNLTPADEIYLETVRILSSGSVTIWVLLNVAYIFLMPMTTEHQHIPFSQEALKTLYIWIRRMAFVALLGFFALETGRLICLPEAGEKLLLQISSLAITLMAIFTMMSLHRNLKNWVRVQREKSQRSRLKRALLPYMEYSYIPLIIFIVISYVSWVTSEFDPVQMTIWKSLFTVALFPLLRYGTFCIKKIRFLYIHRNLKALSSIFSQRAIFYGRQIDLILSSFLYFLAFFIILNVWGFDPYYFIFSSTGKLIIEKIFSIFVIIVAALFVTRAGGELLNRYLSSEQQNQNEAHKQKMARFKTIHSVSRNVLRIVVWAPAFLLVLAELDVDILPLLASVGVLTIGLTLGMQSLVKDVITGFFMLLEDAFAVDDLVTINGQMGRIDSLTVRVVRLRATDGSLYTFPYGNITSLCNQNRDFSAAVMLFQVGIEVDINQINEILEKISKDLRKDPKTRSLVVDTIQIDGVNEINDHALEIRAIVKTKPSMHYKVKWAFNLLLKQYLESYKIPSATPRRIAYNYAVEK